jgi:glycosyltransferase involved in cell wall biosynthesis
MTPAPLISAIIPTHNPHPDRLRRTLLALRNQSLAPGQFEVILVNNASTDIPGADFFARCAPVNFSLVDEPFLGLTATRRRGLGTARADVAVLVDDDNVLAPDYLERVLAIFARHPRVGAAGGKTVPEFERDPSEWEREFLPLLALRDLGPEELISTGLRPAGSSINVYPAFAPIGAGMALRRAAWTAWLDGSTVGMRTLSDRRGGELSSSGDNDMMFAALRANWEVGYFPELSLTHLIPAGRLHADYLARLNRGIQKSWMQVLTRHDANPWPPLSKPGAALRKARAWLTYRAWSSSAAYIRWQGACGHFEGRTSA